MKKALMALAAGLLLQGNAHAGCEFKWTHYGDNKVRDLVAQHIGSHVTDEYCTRFNRDNELVIQFSAYLMPNMAAGHASVGIRKRDSYVLPIMTYSSLSTDTDGRTLGAANDLAARATFRALDNLMSELRSYKVGR